MSMKNKLNNCSVINGNKNDKYNKEIFSIVAVLIFI